MVISMSDVAASGGYYMAMTGDPIVAYPETETGSIGVVFGKPDLHGLYDKLGVTKDAVERGKHADIDSDYTALTPEERDHAAQRHRRELPRLRRARWRRRGIASSTTSSRWRRAASGWAAQAKAHGLVDELGGLDTAIALVKEKAKIPGVGEGQRGDVSRAAEHSGHAVPALGGRRVAESKLAQRIRPGALPRLDEGRHAAGDADLGHGKVELQDRYVAHPAVLEDLAVPGHDPRARASRRRHDDPVGGISVKGRWEPAAGQRDLGRQGHYREARCCQRLPVPTVRTGIPGVSVPWPPAFPPPIPTSPTAADSRLTLPCQ